MADIINLRIARKRKTREAGEKKAQENRAKFGTPVSLRNLEMTRNAKRQASLDTHKLEKPASCRAKNNDIPDTEN